MTFEDEMRQHAEPVAMHEAGHFVVARALGFPTGALGLTVPPTLFARADEVIE